MRPEKLLKWIFVWGAGLITAFAPMPLRSPAPVERTIRIEASSFAFTPGVVQVNPGDQVTIELVAKDVVHGLHIDGYDLALTAEPGQTASLSFTADQAGSFRFRCSVTCGAMHPFMIGKINVGTNSLLWRASGLALLAALAGAFYFARPRSSRL